MELRWTEEAAFDLERIADYLFDRTPAHAEKVLRRIYDGPAALLKSPYRGRPGKKDGTREFVLPSLPYIVVYRIAGDAIHVIRILHGAQAWP